jgi:hypothetical protein
LPSGTVPEASVPIRFPATTTPDPPSIETPAPVLPEITLPAPGAVAPLENV